jgi:hypothetical protein
MLGARIELRVCTLRLRMTEASKQCCIEPRVIALEQVVEHLAVDYLELWGILCKGLLRSRLASAFGPSTRDHRTTRKISGRAGGINPLLFKVDDNKRERYLLQLTRRSCLFDMPGMATLCAIVSIVKMVVPVRKSSQREFSCLFTTS